MCKSIAEGGYRCPCSGGKRPTPTTRAERRELAESVSNRRRGNRQAAADYRVAQAIQRQQAEAWVQQASLAQVEARLSEIAEKRGCAAERAVINTHLPGLIMSHTRSVDAQVFGDRTFAQALRSAKGRARIEERLRVPEEKVDTTYAELMKTPEDEMLFPREDFGEQLQKLTVEEALDAAKCERQAPRAATWLSRMSGGSAAGMAEMKLREELSRRRRAAAAAPARAAAAARAAAEQAARAAAREAKVNEAVERMKDMIPAALDAAAASWMRGSGHFDSDAVRTAALDDVRKQFTENPTPLLDSIVRAWEGKSTAWEDERDRRLTDLAIWDELERSLKRARTAHNRREGAKRAAQTRKQRAAGGT